MARGKVRKLNTPYIDDKIANLILKLVGSESPEEVLSIIEKHPVLLTKKTFDLIDLLIEGAYESEEEAIEPLLDMRAILAFYKEFGTERIREDINVVNYEPPKQIQKNLQAIEKLREQYESKIDARVISKAIRLMDKVLGDPMFEETPETFQYVTLFEAANMGIEAGMLMKDMDHLDKALECATRASKLAPDHHLSIELKFVIGEIHSIKFALTSEPKFADEAIRTFKGVVDEIPDKSENKARVFSTLAQLIFQKTWITRDPSQIDEGIGYLRKALSQSRKMVKSYEGTELFLKTHLALGNAYLTRAHYSQKVKDINDAIKWYRTGLRELEKEFSFYDEKPAFLKGLSEAYFERYGFTKLEKDLIEANQLISLCLSLTPDDDVYRHEALELAREIFEAIMALPSP